MRSVTLALALSTALLAGCASSAADKSTSPDKQDSIEADWRAAVAKELGNEDFDFLSLQNQAAVDCQRPETKDWIPTLALTGELSTTEVTLIGLQHACPAVADAFEAAVATVEAAEDPLDLVCGPDAELGADDQLKADMVCEAVRGKKG